MNSVTRLKHAALVFAVLLTAGNIVVDRIVQHYRRRDSDGRRRALQLSLVPRHALLADRSTEPAVMRSAMKPTIVLRLSSIAFGALWTAGMLWSSGSIDRPHVIILVIVGSLAGYAWCYAMRWAFHFLHLFPSKDHSSDSGARH